MSGFYKYVQLIRSLLVNANTFISSHEMHIYHSTNMKLNTGNIAGMVTLYTKMVVKNYIK